MTEGTSEVEMNEMHVMFADWIRPSALSLSREDIKLRWAGVDYICSELVNYETEIELIKLALGMPISNDGPDQWLRKAFKKFDDLYPMVAGSNEFEIKTLASACIATCLESEEFEDISSLTTALLAASFCGNRVFSDSVNLHGMSTNIALNEGTVKRKNKVTKAPSFEYDISSATNEAIEAVAENQPEHYVQAFKSLLGEFKAHMKAGNESTKEYVCKVNNQIDIQNEELEILWWLFGGKSNIFDISFLDINQNALPMMLGFEFAKRTKIEAELPSIQGLVKKAGLGNEQEIMFKDVINSSKEFAEKLLEKEDYCPIILPSLYALSITKKNDSWQRLWEKDTGLNAKSKASGKDWAIQIYREFLYDQFWR